MPKRKSKGEHPLRKRLKQWIGRFDGNYCGDEWSNARYQMSVAAGTVPPVTPLDKACKLHDEELGQQMDPMAADFRFARRALGTALTPQSLPGRLKSVAAATAVGLQGIARRLNFVEDMRRPRLGAGAQRLLIDGPQVLGPADPHFFPILRMKKYAKRNRKPAKKGRKRRGSYKKRKYNKKRSSYRSRRTTNRRSRGSSNYVSFVTEYGQTTSDAQIAICGHATTAQGVLKTMCQVMVRSLFAKHGKMFVSWDEIIEQDSAADAFGHQVLIKWLNDIESTNYGTQVFNLSNTVTYKSLAQSIEQYLTGLINANTNVFYLQSLEYLLTNDIFTVKHQILAKIDVRKATLKWNFNSSIRIQNRTANASLGQTTDANNVNPLEARVYYGKYGKNFFEPYFKVESAEAGYKAWAPFSNYGAFSDGAANHTADTAWKELPTKAMTGAHKVKPFSLHPGQVIVDKMGAKGTIGVNKLFAKLFNALTIQGSNIAVPQVTPMEFGIARAYGFDKLIWDRSEAAPVLIGFEVNQRYGMTISYSKVKSAPWVDVYVP